MTVHAEIGVSALRAFDTATGKQYVVICAGGARQSPDRGDYVIAYALPD